MIAIEKYGNGLEKLKCLVAGIWYQKNKIFVDFQSNFRWEFEKERGGSKESDRLLRLIKYDGSPSRIIVCITDNVDITEKVCTFTVKVKCLIKSSGIESHHDYDVVIIMKENLVSYIHITDISKDKVSVKHQIKALHGEYCMVREEDVYYMEAMHNHVIWYMNDRTITEYNSLNNLENQLSDRFVRLQKGYLVNKEYVKSIRKFEVEMENGAVLAIPEKKYKEKREELLRAP